MTEFFTGLSDFVSAHWGEVLAIFGGGGIGVALVTFVLRLILIKVQSKSTKKINAPIVEKFEQITAQVNAMEDKVKQVFNDSLTKYTDIIRQEFNQLVEKYQEVKKAIYTEVINGNEEAQKLLAELETKTIEIQEIVEDIKQGEETVSEPIVEQEVKEDANEPKTAEKDQNSREYVVVTKTYGE